MAADVAPDPGRMTLGARDTQLLELRAATFGDELVGLATCPGCGQDLELTFSTRELVAAAHPAGEESIASSVGGYEVSARQLTVADLVAATHLAADVPEARRRLLYGAVLEATRDGSIVPAGELPEAVLDDLEARLGAADPVADTQLTVHCSDCGMAWAETFDIASFFWVEVSAWAARTLEDVHQLASAYGWPEDHILDMAERRRRTYLELVSS
ncbi:MAG TPA: hypothetical protein VFJ14_13200 [Nocardioidaceae bacterium]|nr:hypothetical protein [Nocardioidaceae bacterium]